MAARRGCTKLLNIPSICMRMLQHRDKYLYAHVSRGGGKIVNNISWSKLVQAILSIFRFFKKTTKKGVNSWHYVLSATPKDSAHTLLGPIYSCKYQKKLQFSCIVSTCYDIYLLWNSVLLSAEIIQIFYNPQSCLHSGYWYNIIYILYIIFLLQNLPWRY